MYVDASSLSSDEAYRLAIGSIVPRPIAWVTSGIDVVNLAPFSFFTWVSRHPPMLGFTVSPREGGRKDTIANVEAIGEFVVNIASEEMLSALHASSAYFDRSVSEANEVDVALAPSEIVQVPRLRDVPISMECRFHSTTAFSPTGGEFVVGTVVAWHIADDVLANGRIQVDRVRPIGRLAGPRYTSLGPITELPPVYDG